VGFGDIHPVTPPGKVLVICLILAGVSCFVGLVGNAIEYMIETRERITRMHNLNMIIGVFFSEVGTGLIRQLSIHDPNVSRIQSVLMVSDTWSDEDFLRAEETLVRYESRIDSKTIPLPALRDFLVGRRAFMLSLFGNPQISEHDRFTPLLRAIFHFAEELDARGQLTDLPDTDYAHLSVDINRVYALLIVEWITYMRHLKKHYPFLFSLAMRTNPFDAHASAIVR